MVLFDTKVLTVDDFVSKSGRTELAVASENYLFQSGEILFVQTGRSGEISACNQSFRRQMNLPADSSALNLFNYLKNETGELSGGYGDMPGLPMTFTSERTGGKFLFSVYEGSEGYYLFGQRLDINDYTVFSQLAELSTEMGRLVQDLKRSQRELISKNEDLNNTIEELNRALEEIEQLKEREKKNIYRATIAGTQHILNNLLNQLVLIDIEINRTPDFDSGVAIKFDIIREQAKLLTKKLSSVENMDEAEIKAAVLP